MVPFTMAEARNGCPTGRRDSLPRQHARFAFARGCSRAPDHTLRSPIFPRRGQHRVNGAHVVQRVTVFDEGGAFGRDGDDQQEGKAECVG